MPSAALSLTVIVWPPEVDNVALNVPTPLTNVVSAGNMALGSVLVKCTVPV